MPNGIPTSEMPSGGSPINSQLDVEGELDLGDYDPTDLEIEGIEEETQKILLDAKELNLGDSRLRRLIETSDLISNSRPKALEKRIGDINKLEGVLRQTALG